MLALLPLASGLQRGVDAGVISEMKNLAVRPLRVRHRDDVRPLRHELIGSRDVAVDDFRPGCGALPRRIGTEHFVLVIRQHNGNGFAGLGVLDEATGPFAGFVVVGTEFELYRARLG